MSDRFDGQIKPGTLRGTLDATTEHIPNSQMPACSRTPDYLRARIVMSVPSRAESASRNREIAPLCANSCGSVDAELGNAKREGDFRGDALMLVRHAADRLSEVDAGLRRAERHMCQHLHETVIKFVHFDAYSLLWRRRRCHAAAEAVSKIAHETKQLIVFADERDG